MDEYVEASEGLAWDVDLSRREKISRLEDIGAEILKSKHNITPPTASTVFKNVKWILEDGVDNTRREAWGRISTIRSSQWRGADCDIVAGLLEDGLLEPTDQIVGGVRGATNNNNTNGNNKSRRGRTAKDNDEKSTRPKRKSSQGVNYAVKLLLSDNDGDSDEDSFSGDSSTGDDEEDGSGGSGGGAGGMRGMMTTRRASGAGTKKLSEKLDGIKNDFSLAVYESATDAIGRLKELLGGRGSDDLKGTTLLKDVGRFQRDLQTVVDIMDRIMPDSDAGEDREKKKK